MLDKLTNEHFDPHVGTEFTVTRDDVTFKVTLVHVEARGAPLSEGGRQAFSVTFEAEESAPEHISQGTFTLGHGTMETIDVFMTRIHPRMHTTTVTLEAIFS